MPWHRHRRRPPGAPDRRNGDETQSVNNMKYSPDAIDQAAKAVICPGK